MTAPHFRDDTTFSNRSLEKQVTAQNISFTNRCETCFVVEHSVLVLLGPTDASIGRSGLNVCSFYRGIKFARVTPLFARPIA